MELQNKLDLSELAQSSAEFRLLESRSIFISEAINSSVARRVVSNLLFLDALSKDTIFIYLNSPGGEVNSGFAIYDTIRFIASDVKIINTGLCASIATIINIAVKKQNRYSMPNCKFLIHQPLISGQIYGQASDIEITAREILKTRHMINELLAKECGQDLAKVEKDTVRDYWMNAQQATEYGLVAKVIVSKKDI